MSEDKNDLLSFREFVPVHEYESANRSRAEISVNSPHKNNLVENPEESLVDMSAMNPTITTESDTNAGPRTSASSLLTIEYYKQYFNVDSYCVVDRILRSLLPRRVPRDYLKNEIDLNPDLYGPFWIVITLVFSIAISGNVASYLQRESDFHWRYNFHLVSYAATALFFYVCFLPIGLWILLKWSVKPAMNDVELDATVQTPPLLSLICIYGYSLSIYIPVSVFLVIQISSLQWVLVTLGALLSGSALIIVLMPVLKFSRVFLFLVAGMLIAHFALAAGFMLCFFHVSKNLSSPGILIATSTIASIKNPGLSP